MVGRGALLLVLALLLVFLAAAPSVNIVDPTPPNGTITYEPYFAVNITTDESSAYILNNFNDSLVLWLRMDNRSGTTIYDESRFGNDGTTSGVGAINSSGIWGDFWNQSTTDSDSSTDTIRVSNSASLNVSDVTISLWVNVETQQFTTMLDYIDTGNSGYAVKIDNNNGFKVFFTVGDGSASRSERYNGDLSIGEWEHIAVRYNSSSGEMDGFRDGALQTQQWTNGNSISGPIEGYSKDMLLLRRDNSGTYQNLDGSFDELIIFDRALTDDEIASLYNASVNQYYNNFSLSEFATYNYTPYVVNSAGERNETDQQFIIYKLPDTTPPNITLISPGNNSYYNGSQVLFNFTIADTEYATVDCNITIDGSTAASGTASNTSSSGINASGITDGNHTYTITCADPEGNAATSEERVFIVDTIKPEINVVSPTPDNGTTITDSYVEINATTNDNLTTYVVNDFNRSLIGWWRFDNNAGAGETTALAKDWSGTGNDATIDGEETWPVGKFSGSINFTDDALAPFSQTFPEQTTFSAWFKTTQAANQVVVGWYSSNLNYYQVRLQSGTSVFAYIRNSTGQDAGTQLGNYVVDQWHHVASSFNGSHRISCFDGDCTAPYDSPYIPVGTVGFRMGDGVFGYEGLIDEVTVFERALNVSEMLALYNATQNQYYGNISYEEETSYNYTLYAVDQAGNINETTREFSYQADIVAPQIVLLSPINNTNTSNTTVLFGFNATDNLNNNLNCSLIVNDTIVANNDSIIPSVSSILNFTPSYEQEVSWYVNCTDSAFNSNISTTRSVLFDRTAPSINFTTFTPNTTANVDPITNISFQTNVTDELQPITNVSLVVFNGTTTSYITMDNSQDTFNTTLQTSDSAYNLTFYIQATDQTNNTRNSTNQTIEVAYDCTWNNSLQSGQSYLGFSENKEIYNLTINNTGDVSYPGGCSLVFQLSHNLAAGSIYFDNSASNEFVTTYTSGSVAAQSSEILPINFSFGSGTAQQDASITINALGSQSQTGTQYSNFTAITSNSGAYLLQDITTSPTEVSLIETNFSITSYIQNIAANGSDYNNAFNVSINWSLPDWFTVTGNTTLFYPNLTNNSQIENTITVSLNSANLADRSPGSQTITLQVQGKNSTGDNILDADDNFVLNTSTTIIFTCNATADSITIEGCGTADGDYVAPTTTVTTESSSGGGGSSSGGGGGSGFTNIPLTTTQESLDEFVTNNEELEFVRGSSETFTILLENTFGSRLEDITVELTGLYAGFLSLEQTQIQALMPNESIELLVNIDTPTYFEEGIYNLTLNVTGIINATRQVGNFTRKSITTVHQQKFITLRIHEFSKEEASQFLQEAQNLIDILKENNLPTRTLEALIAQANTLLNQKSHSSSNGALETIQEQYNLAMNTQATLEEVKALVRQAAFNGIQTSRTQRMQLLSESALARGDFVTSYQRAEDAKVTYALETVGQFNVLRFIEIHLVTILISLLGLTMVAILLVYVGRFIILKGKLHLLHKERDVLGGLVQQIQRDTFIHNKMTMEEYAESHTQYNQRLGKVIQDTVNIENKIVYLLKPFISQHTKLLKEKERLEGLLKDIQKKYLETNTMETRMYERRVQSYLEGLADVEEQLAEIEANKAIKKSVALVGLLVLCFMLVQPVGAIEYNISEESQQYKEQLDFWQGIIDESTNYPIERLQNSHSQAQDFLISQVVAQESGRTPDYSRVQNSLNSIEEIYNTMLIAYDQLNALNTTLQFQNESLQTYYDQAYDAYTKGRFEESIDVTDQAYEFIIQQEAFETRLEAFSEAAQQNIQSFLTTHAQTIIITIVVLGALSFVGVRIGSYYYIKRTIKRLEHKMVIVRGLVAQTQKEYFNTGKINERVYRIRTKKYAEILRDAERQLPLLREKVIILRWVSNEKRKESTEKAKD